MGWVEIVGFVTGALCVWLAGRQHVANFAVGIANNLVFLVLFASQGIYANAGLQVVYVVLAALGWYWWRRPRVPDERAGRRELAVSRTPRLVWPVAAVAAAVLTLALVALLSLTDASVQPWWDATTTALSLVAQVMLGRKWLGSWAVWIVTDVLLVGLYASVGLWLTSALYVLFIGLCVHAWRGWAAEVRERTAPGTSARDGAAQRDGTRVGA